MPLTLTSVYAHTYIRLEHRGKKRTNGRMMARANTSDAQPRCLLTLLTYGNVTQRQLLYKCFPITHACMLHAIVPAAESANSPFDLTYIRLKNAKKCTLLLDICNSSLSSSEPKAANSVNFFPLYSSFFVAPPASPCSSHFTPRGEVSESKQRLIITLEEGGLAAPLISRESRHTFPVQILLPVSSPSSSGY